MTNYCDPRVIYALREYRAKSGELRNEQDFTNAVDVVSKKLAELEEKSTWSFLYYVSRLGPTYEYGT